MQSAMDQRLSVCLAGWHGPAERASISAHGTKRAKQYVLKKPEIEFEN